MALALILGGASCVWDDACAVLRLAAPDIIIATNEMIARWPGPLAHAATLHPLNLPGWQAGRRIKGNAPPGLVWACKAAPGVDRVTSDWRGSSGLFAAKVALIDLRMAGAILAGVPLDRSPHFARGEGPWRDAHAFYPGWIDHKREIAGRLRSMGGWTQQLVGAPTPEWLASVGAAPPDDAAELIAKLERERDLNSAQSAVT